MREQFVQFSENIRLTDKQEADAKIKYDGVCSKLHNFYYNNEYNGKTKLLFGSYKTKTNIRPIIESQDVDVLFKIPKETFEKYHAYKNNGPSSLLQEIKNYLKEKYTTTDEIKAWGKIILVKFSDHTHNVEILPAYKNYDGTFTIPNTENGESWDNFNPKLQIEQFTSSNSKTKGLTADLSRMIKTWVRHTSSCNYKSFKILIDVILFLDKNFTEGADFSDYSNVVKSFFEYLYRTCEDNIKSNVKTAFERANKAYNFERNNKYKEASEEWRKIFGDKFPLIFSNTLAENKTRIFYKPSSPYGNYTIN